MVLMQTLFQRAVVVSAAVTPRPYLPRATDTLAGNATEEGQWAWGVALDDWKCLRRVLSNSEYSLRCH